MAPGQEARPLTLTQIQEIVLQIVRANSIIQGARSMENATMRLSRRDFAKLVGFAGASAALAAVGDAGFDADSRGAEACAPHDLEMAPELESELCPAYPTAQPGPQAPKDATAITRKANAAVLRQLDFASQEDFEDASRGFIATLADPVIKGSDGHKVWNLKVYDFLQQEDAPPTVNPSLWRQARLNMNNGLFKVTDRVYQWRGFDMSNMTIIEGDKGLILIDPLISMETARAGLDLYIQQRGQRPVAAVIYTHSHVDHFGGVKGVVDEADVKAGKVAVLAPGRFLESAVSENVTAGTAMGRRTLMPRGERGQLDVGLAKAQSVGHTSLISPTDVIVKTGEVRTIDGVEMVFQLAPDTEAPAEMTIYFPQFRVFDSAELACATLHNTLTLRGAQVRDANAWAYYLNEAIALYGDKTEVAIAQHHWPRWGREKVLKLLTSQRDLYQYLHDQTLRLANQGYTMVEIAEMIELPDSLAREWYNRDYYGTVNHDVKAVYQKYLGWYDANPANLHALPPEAAARKYVEYMGGPQAVIARARADFNKGDYRWVAQVMNHVVFAYPDNVAARNLEADALEQLGYQAESATWRNCYLTGAYELRNGKLVQEGGYAAADTVKALTIPMLFDYIGVRLNGPKANGKKIVLNWDFTDLDEKYILNLENSALTYMSDRQAADADATLTLTRAALDAIMTGQTTLEQAVTSGSIKITGNGKKVVELFSLLDTFRPDFNIVVP
jgi:alkyl sulfatase BDS1-like metallo-beta-lactamase superfamily hydrolase